jgi:hypothetical protein
VAARANVFHAQLAASRWVVALARFTKEQLELVVCEALLVVMSRRITKIDWGFTHNVQACRSKLSRRWTFTKRAECFTSKKDISDLVE